MPHDFDKNDASDQDAKRARRTAKALRDILRKTFAQGGDARQNTEELLRAVLGEVKIPREYVNIILQQINATRGELLSVVAGEVRTFLEDANLGEELAKILTSLSFEIRTEIRFIPNEDVLRPSVKSRVGVKSTRPKSKSRVEPDIDDDDDDAFVETRGSAAIDKAIQSRVASLASMFIKGIVEGDDDDDLESDSEESTSVDATKARTSKPKPRTSKPQASESSPKPSDVPDLTIEAPDAEDEDDHRRGAFGPRDLRLRMSLGPDFRRRAEAAATQVATAGRVTASLSAATAASAVSAAANRAQAVVRGGRNLTASDARDIMWKRWVGPDGPDLVGNPVIGAPGDYIRPEEYTQPTSVDPASVTSGDSVPSDKSDADSTGDAMADPSEISSPASEKSTRVKVVDSSELSLEDAELSSDTSKPPTGSEAAGEDEAKGSVDATSTADSGQKAEDLEQDAARQDKRTTTQKSDELISESKATPVKVKSAPKKKSASATASTKPQADRTSTSTVAPKKSQTSTGTATKKKAAPGSGATTKKPKAKASSTASTPKKSTKSTASKSSATSKAGKAPRTSTKQTTPSKPKAQTTSKSKSSDGAGSKSS